MLEPQGKNTLAPIALLTQKIYSFDRKAKIIVLPCDHFVENKDRFIRVLRRALKSADSGYILTLGFIPKRPETGYGYIKSGSRRRGYYLVDKFVEKPDIKRAGRYIKDKRYYWNAGIFVFRADSFLNELKSIKPKVYRIIEKIKNNKDMLRYWRKLPVISIDYAIMEKTKKAALLPADYGWIDLGSWQAIEEISSKDACGNILRGKCLDLGSRNILSWSEDRLVATVGLKDIIIVDTKDALLVCAKDKAQQVKKLVSLLRRGNYKRHT
jgi:mannose-1-phosphate guanylyltransferase/mannose-6-phosphate isomerase